MVCFRPDGQRIVSGSDDETVLSTRALAQRAGLTQGDVAGIETGRRKPSRETLVRLANALGPGVLLPATE
jgi:hypothetical protein